MSYSTDPVLDAARHFESLDRFAAQRTDPAVYEAEATAACEAIKAIARWAITPTVMRELVSSLSVIAQHLTNNEVRDTVQNYLEDMHGDLMAFEREQA